MTYEVEVECADCRRRHRIAVTWGGDYQIEIGFTCPDCDNPISVTLVPESNDEQELR